MASADHWKQLHRRFDPEEPATMDEWRARRQYNTADSIFTGLARGFGDTRFLLLGTVGTGKSTELYRVAQERSANCAVILLDVFKHFQRTISDPSAIQHVQPWEVLMLIGLAVHGAGERYHLSWPAHLTSDFESASASLLPKSETSSGKLDVPKLASAVATVVGGAVAGPIGGLAGNLVGSVTQGLGEIAKTLEWKVQLGLAGRTSPRDQDQRVHALLRSVNAMIGELQQHVGELDLFIDGLDRISTESTTRDLFIESSLLASLDCPTVVIGPLLLSRAGIVSQIRVFRPKILANVPVLDRSSPRELGTGCDFFVELFEKRTRDMSEGARTALSEAQLRKLAYYSGGRSRDFVRFIALVAEQAADRGLEVADDRAVTDAIDERRRLMEAGLTRNDIELLTTVAEDPEHLLPGDDAVGRLLDQWCLLPYPNQSEWYFPHPLLTINRVKLG